MKTIAYLDCPSGISGDMCLGAVVDAGVPLDYLQAQLHRLGLSDEFSLSVTPTLHQGLRALKAEVNLLEPTVAQPTPAERAHPSQPTHSHQPSDHEHLQGPVSSSAGSEASLSILSSTRPQSEAGRGRSRDLPAIEQLITQANLPQRAWRWSLAIFRQLAEAEAAVHGIAIDQVHFHEVGATDAIVDIVGTCLGFDYLGIERLVCSPLPTGQGRVKTAHGWLPVPAPAVLKLMEQRQIPIYSNGLRGELVTPTGAAIVATLAEQFGGPPPLHLRQVGLGAGHRVLSIPNILRLWVGAENEMEIAHLSTTATRHPVSDPDTVAVLETQVDDMLPQVVGYLYEQLFAVGALDVFTQPVAMKKCRPGLLITVICHPEAESRCAEILFSETPTLGIRHQRQRRTVLPRELKPLSTPHGTVTMKVAYHPQSGAVLNVHPEYEDCAALARQHGLPWQAIYQTAVTTWYQHHPNLPSPSAS